MRAVTIQEGRLSWADQPDPEPGDSELLVAVDCAGVNSADLAQAAGFYPAPPGAPQDVPGLELCGEVVAVGQRTSRFRAGDRVMAVVGGGAQAELAVVDESSAMAVPSETGSEEAGGFPEIFTTAYDALFTQCHMTMGERVLVTGAAGGVGTAAVQLAAATGSYVTASVRSDELRERLMEFGAAAALSPDEALEAGPYDVALELVGGSSLPGVLLSMAIGGRISVIGVGGGGSCELDLFGLMSCRARICGSTLRSRSIVEKANVAEAVEAHVVPLLRAGHVRVPICAKFPMEKAASAYERFSEGGKLGKILLVNERSSSR